MSRQGASLEWVAAGDELELEATPHDLVVYYRRSGEGAGGMDAVLLAETRSARPAAVVVLVDRYDEAEAVELFQMGVTDYLALQEHAGRLPELFEAMLGPGDTYVHDLSVHVIRAWAADLVSAGAGT
jgi:hypothetical protein